MFSTVDHQMLRCPPMSLMMERRWNPKSCHVGIAPNCPRCASPNTKFCYYNNYSLSQPRYFCKGCRRYWTKGGSLRNVPVGGGCRKNRRSRSSVRSNQVGTSYARATTGSDRISVDSLTESRVSVENSVDIDLAVVYANYLNQNSLSMNNVATDQDSSSGASCGSFDLPVSTSDIQLENIIIECDKSFDLIDEAQLHEDLCPISTEEDNFPSAFELQTMLSENLPEEDSWMDDTAFASFTWQPIVHSQEFGSLPHEDQLKISSNLTNDNWRSSSIDLSGFEIFPRP